jgi:hypothetical protein
MACFVFLGTSRRNFVEGVEFSAISISGEAPASVLEIGSPSAKRRKTGRPGQGNAGEGRKGKEGRRQEYTRPGNTGSVRYVFAEL